MTTRGRLALAVVALTSILFAANSNVAHAGSFDVSNSSGTYHNPPPPPPPPPPPRRPPAVAAVRG